MSDIFLSSTIRSTLLTLNNTNSFITRTSGRLSTGLSVSSPLDNAVAYFQAQSLSNRATDLLGRKAQLVQNVDAVQTAVTALGSATSLLKQVSGIIDSARSATAINRSQYGSQLKTLATQIKALINDSSFQGLNLVNSTGATLTVKFSDSSSSTLTVQGQNLLISKFGIVNTSYTSLGVSASAQNLLSKLGFTRGNLSSYKFSLASVVALFNSNANKAQNYVTASINNINSKAATFANAVNIIQTRVDFTANYANVLSTGAGQLTQADLNTEGANLVSLQTRQQIALQALSFAGQSDQRILSLFR